MVYHSFVVPDSSWRFCGWKESRTTFKGLHVKHHAPKWILFEDAVIKMDLCEWRKSCTTCQHVIQHWAWGYGGASYALANVWLWRWCRISSIHRRKKRIPCIFGLAQFFPPPATSTGSNPLLVRIDSFHNSSLVCSSYAHDWARGKMRYMAATARYTANCMQHSRNTTCNTTRNTTEMLPGAAFQARTEKLTCMSISMLKKPQSSKMLPLPAFR